MEVIQNQSQGVLQKVPHSIRFYSLVGAGFLVSLFPFISPAQRFQIGERTCNVNKSLLSPLVFQRYAK